MSYTIKSIHLGRIYLDNENPRHDPIQAEPEIIRHLINSEDIRPLARHIAESGSLSPLERIAVVPHPTVADAYITAEGNRRICAIKLLSDPDKADSEKNKKYFRDLSGRMENRPRTIEAVVFQNKTTARPWLALRHEGAQGGIGTKSWNPTQIARFSSQGENTSNPNLLALLVKDYVRGKELLSDAQLEKVSLTTMTRYLSSPVFRDMLGLVDKKTLRINVLTEEFDRAILRFLMDATNPKSGVNSRTSVTQRRDYADKLRAEGVAPGTRGQAITDLSRPPETPSPSSPEIKPSRDTPPSRRNNKNPDKREKVIPSRFAVRITDPVLKRLYDELRDLEAEKFSFSSTYLLRAMLERMASRFLQQYQLSNPQDLHQKLFHLEKELEKQNVPDRARKVLRTMAAEKESRLSPDTIGNFVHGGAIPTRIDVIRTWDSLEPIILHVLQQLK